MLIGLFYGLVSAFIWAGSSLAVKALAARIDTTSFNAFRAAVGGLFFFILLPFFGGWQSLVSLPLTAQLWLAISAVLGIALGDTVYFRSLTAIGAARAMPLSGMYPVFAWIIAASLLGEPVTIQALVGTALVIGSLYLLAPAVETSPARPAHLNRWGVIGAVGAALLWAIATTLLKAAVADNANPIVVNAFRLPIAALAILPFLHQRQGLTVWREYKGKTLLWLIALAIFSTGIGSITWILSIEYLGAARAALINTTAPLTGVPLAVILLHERLTRRIALGVALSFVGVWLIL